VLNTCKDLERIGFEVTYLKVDEFGHVKPEQIAQALREETILVSIAHANGEIGTVQPIAEIARAVKAYDPKIIFHVDGVQTVGTIKTNVEILGVDLFSLTAHKFYGPKGIGGLYVRDGVSLQAQIAGGGQEHSLRAGTESVPLIVGMAVAMDLACQEIESEQAYWLPIRDQLIKRLLSEIDDSKLNGHPADRLPTNVNVSFFGVNCEDTVLRLDRLGICASTGTACEAGNVEPSYVLLGLGLSRAWALGSLRLTLGKGCRGMDIDQVIEHIRKIIEDLRSTCYVPSKYHTH
jgi:cysteine desulfurase